MSRSVEVGPAWRTRRRSVATPWRLVVIALLTLAMGAVALAGLRDLREDFAGDRVSLALESATVLATNGTARGGLTLRLEIANGGLRPLIGRIGLTRGAGAEPSVPRAGTEPPAAAAASRAPVRVAAGAVAVVELTIDARCGEVVAATLESHGIESRRIDVAAPCPGAVDGTDAP